MLIQLLKVGFNKFLCNLFSSTHVVQGQGTSIELNQVTSYFYTSRGKRRYSSTSLVLTLKIDSVEEINSNCRPDSSRQILY